MQNFNDLLLTAKKPSLFDSGLFASREFEEEQARQKSISTRDFAHTLSAVSTQRNKETEEVDHGQRILLPEIDIFGRAPDEPPVVLEPPKTPQPSNR